MIEMRSLGIQKAATVASSIPTHTKIQSPAEDSNSILSRVTSIATDALAATAKLMAI